MDKRKYVKRNDQLSFDVRLSWLIIGKQKKLSFFIYAILKSKDQKYYKNKKYLLSCSCLMFHFISRLA